MNVIANQPVWRLLGQPSALHIKWREGRHHGFDDPMTYFDFFDFAGSKPCPSCPGGMPPPTFEQLELPHAFNWSAWRAGTQSVTPPPPPLAASLSDRVGWLLGMGAETSTAGLDGGSEYCESGPVGSEWDYKAELMMHDSFRGCRGEACTHNVTRLSLSFGPYITASLFVPCADKSCSEVEHPLPVVIFLHGFAYQLGFTGIYGLFESEEKGGLIPAIVGRGAAVLAWDLTGHGDRQTEAGHAFCESAMRCELLQLRPTPLGSYPPPRSDQRLSAARH
jgi:hypothetical protein